MTKLTWEDVEKIADELAESILKSNFQPDYIIGITAGGLIPLYFLARKLNLVDKILTISANSYDKDKQHDLKILYLPEVDLSNKKVLLVDEISGTGRTLREIARILIEKYQVRELRTVTFVTMEESEFCPDFYGRTEKKDWVLFPWDKKIN